MPRPTSRKARELEETLNNIKESLESLPAQELAALLNHVRDEQALEILSGFDKAWNTILKASAQHYALTGRAIPTPPTIEDVFEDAPVSTVQRVSRPDAWYYHEISFCVRISGDSGASQEFISDWITARGGDPRYAIRTILPQLVDDGYLAEDEEGHLSHANSKSDAWYDYQVISYINEHDTGNLPTSAAIHDHIIEQGGHGVEVFTDVLPRLQQMGRISETQDGTWDTTTRRPEAWYDFTIASFIESSDPANPPSTKDVHDHVIERGGHGIIAVTEALPRLFENGILNEVEEDRWDSARRRPDAWYDFQVMSYLDELTDDDSASSKELHDHIIEQGGHGIDVFTKVLPRLKAVGRVKEIDDAEWVPAHRRPRAWYDNVVISTIRACEPSSLPTLKQLHDTVIEKGGHGVVVATDVLPELVESGEVIEVEDGVFDVANRRCDTWFDNTVFHFVKEANEPVTSMQIYEHVIEQGGHGSQIFNEVFPRLVRAGLIAEIETGMWKLGTGVPLALIDNQVYVAIKNSGEEGATLDTCLDGMDDDLAEDEIVAYSLERLTNSGLIESSDSNGEYIWHTTGITVSRKAEPATAKSRKPRRRRLAA